MILTWEEGTEGEEGRRASASRPVCLCSSPLLSEEGWSYGVGVMEYTEMRPGPCPPPLPEEGSIFGVTPEGPGEGSWE